MLSQNLGWDLTKSENSKIPGKDRKLTPNLLCRVSNPISLTDLIVNTTPRLRIEF